MVCRTLSLQLSKAMPANHTARMSCRTLIGLAFHLTRAGAGFHPCFFKLLLPQRERSLCFAHTERQQSSAASTPSMQKTAVETTHSHIATFRVAVTVRSNTAFLSWHSKLWMFGPDGGCWLQALSGGIQMQMHLPEVPEDAENQQTNLSWSVVGRAQAPSRLQTTA